MSFYLNVRIFVQWVKRERKQQIQWYLTPPFVVCCGHADTRARHCCSHTSSGSPASWAHALCPLWWVSQSPAGISEHFTAPGMRQQSSVSQRGLSSMPLSLTSAQRFENCWDFVLLKTSDLHSCTLTDTKDSAPKPQLSFNRNTNYYSAIRLIFLSFYQC